jgi:hypothetical protein
MDLYYWLFPPIMTAAPLLMVWFADRTLPPAPNTPFRRWGKVMLPIAALAIIVGYLGSLWSFGQQPWITHGLSYLYFPVWGFAMALTIRPDPNFGERNLERVERSASLKPRRREMPVSSAWWKIAWSISIVGSAVLIAAAFALSPSTLTWFKVLVVALLTAYSVGLTHWTLPMTLEEPEPLGAAADPTLEKDYAHLRNQRVWILFAMFAIGMPVLLLAMGAGLLWAGDSASRGSTMGIIGAAVGTVFGLLGAACGVWADMKRKRLREMLERAEAR